MPGHHHEV